MSQTTESTFLKRVALRMALRVVGALTPSQQVTAALNQLFAMSIGDRHPATLDQQLANKSWVFAANRQIAGRAVRAQPVLEIVSRSSVGKMPKRTAVYEHPFLTLLDQPNLDQTRSLFHWQQIVQLNTAGRCYVLVEPAVLNLDFSKPVPGAVAPNGVGPERRILSTLARMTLLEPDRVRPFSALGRRAAAFEYFDLYGGHGIYPAAPATYAQREEWKKNPQPFVVRIFMPSPDTWNGQSVTEAADWAINTSFGLNQMWQNQLKNGLHAGLIFYLKKKGLSEVERFEKAVAIVKAGIGKAGEPLILPDETIKVEPSPLNMKDLQYESLGDYSRHEILAVLGASDSVVGISGHSNRSSADTMERQFALGTIDPMNDLIADAYNAYILPLYPGQSPATKYELRFTSAAQTDEVVQTQVLTTQAGGPIITPNEARAELDKPPVAGGDTLRQPKGAGGDAGGGDGSSGGGFGGGGAGDHAASGGGSSGGSEEGGPAGGLPPLDGGNTGNHGALPSLAGANEADKVTQPSAMPQLKRSERGDHPNRTRRRIAADHPLAALHDPAARRAKLRALDKDRFTAEIGLRRAIAPVFASWKDATHRAVLAKYRTSGTADTRADTDTKSVDQSEIDQIADTTNWAKELRAAYLPWAADWARRVVVRALHDYGLDDEQIAQLRDDVMTKLEANVTDAARQFADQVSDTQSKLIGDALADGTASELGETEFANLVAGTFPGFDDPRLRLMGQTETTGVLGLSVFGVADRLSQGAGPSETGNAPGGPGQTGGVDDALANGGAPLGDDVGLMWLSMRDDKVRDTHREADGQVVRYGDLFDVGGSQMQFPGDDSHGADVSEIANCRCDAIVCKLDHDEGWDKAAQDWKQGG